MQFFTQSNSKSVTWLHVLHLFRQDSNESNFNSVSFFSHNLKKILTKFDINEWKCNLSPFLISGEREDRGDISKYCSYF